jgi:Flp pilus assembly protein TadG
MVTAELAAALPILMLVLAVAVSAVVLVGDRTRLQDASTELARAAARGDPSTGRALAEQLAPGAVVTVQEHGGMVVATARSAVHPLAAWLPAVTVQGTAVAALEPSTAAPP